MQALVLETLNCEIHITRFGVYEKVGWGAERGGSCPFSPYPHPNKVKEKESMVHKQMLAYMVLVIMKKYQVSQICKLLN